MFGEARKILVQIEIYYEAPKDADKIKNLLESALNRLSKKHKFSCFVVYEKIKIFEGFQRTIIKVFTGSDRFFSLTKDFIYWALEDYRRKRGFEVPYGIEHVKEDALGLEKGPGEE